MAPATTWGTYTLNVKTLGEAFVVAAAWWWWWWGGGGGALWFAAPGNNE